MYIPTDLKVPLITVCAVGALGFVLTYFFKATSKVSIPTIEEASESFGRATCVSQAT